MASFACSFLRQKIRYNQLYLEFEEKMMFEKLEFTFKKGIPKMRKP